MQAKERETRRADLREDIVYIEMNIYKASSIGDLSVVQELIKQDKSLVIEKDSVRSPLSSFS